MIVDFWMTRDLVTVSPETLISEAATAMARRRISHVLVTRGGEPNGALLGIVSTHDIARAYPKDLNPFSVVACDRPVNVPVGDVMRSPVRTVASHTSVEEAAVILREERIGALPVVIGPRLAGIVTRSDILAAFGELLGYGEEGAQVIFDLAEHEDLVTIVIDIGRRHGLRLASVLSMHHEGRRLGLVRLYGHTPEPFVDEVWRSGHRVISVAVIDAKPSARALAAGGASR